ncbi:MAG: hypothetical protein AAGC93_08160 [Cyanobacteria bacterium P01_F01_bin.53]
MEFQPIARSIDLSTELPSGRYHQESFHQESFQGITEGETPNNISNGSANSVGFGHMQKPTMAIQGGRETGLANHRRARTAAKIVDAEAASQTAILPKNLRKVEKVAGKQARNWKFFGTSVKQNLKVDEVVEKIESGQMWVVNSRRRNGLIVVREFHAEFAGPGAAVGGDLDDGIVKIIPIGNLSLLEPDSHEAHQNAIKIRLQWIRLTQNFTDQASPDDRARMILEQFKTYFDQATVDLVPDEAFAMLVGVLPQTIHRVRSSFVW